MSVAAIVLCGGESRRMGRSKALLPFGPESLVQRVVRIVGNVAHPVVVVAAPGQELPPLPGGTAVVRDSVPGQGPLRGLLTGLSSLPGDSDLVFVTATDVPFLRPDWIRHLTTLIGRQDAAIPECGDRLHPLAAVYRVAAAIPAIDLLLGRGQFRLAALRDVLPTRIVAADELRRADPHLATLWNLNTPEDYLRALAEAGCVEGEEPGSDTTRRLENSIIYQIPKDPSSPAL